MEDVRLVKIELTLACPESEELQVLIDTILEQQKNVMDYEIWVRNIQDGMEKLTLLLESRKIYQGGITLKQETRPFHSDIMDYN